MEALLDHGEGLLVPERMIVAPTVGTFRPVELGAGSQVTCGQTVGVLEGPGTETPVESPFANAALPNKLSASARFVARPMNGLDSAVKRVPRSVESASAIECA